MEILPTGTVTTLTTGLTDVVAANAVPVIGVIALGVGVSFVVRWFNKGTRRIKA